jgi:SWI/SNF-related matrix-associated actin-dependent regulator of chromatin subfamily A containing DEAD/H box 1
MSMAPAGTAFRAPNVQRGPARAEPISIDSEDEAMPYVGESSGDDAGRAKNIKPTEPKLRRGASGRQEPTKLDFSSVVAKYKHGEKEREKRGGYVGTVFDPRNRDGPATSDVALPDRSNTVTHDDGRYWRIPKRRKPNDPSSRVSKTNKLKTLHDIEDFQLRGKVSRMQDILSGWSLDILYETLLQNGGNADDAMNQLMGQDPEDHRLTFPEADHLASSLTLEKPQPKLRAKQKLTEPVKSLQERYGKNAKPSAPEQRPRRRLVQGRRERTPEPSPPPQESSSAAETPAETPRSASSEIGDDEFEVDSDSGVVTGLEAGTLTSFFNTCTVPQLMDLASISEAQANIIISHRPFKSTQEVRSIEDSSIPPLKRKRVTMGGKVVNEAAEMWDGYRAIDRLVTECHQKSEELRTEMAKWGVDIFGASKSGELGIMSWKVEDKTPRDSGIATPTTAPQSASEETGDEGVKRKVKSRDKPSSLCFFPQPKSMNEGVVLKEYQVVGVNWLDLLFRCRLSGILADDMGLGKTCQVIAFFARLKELGIHGPHIVVVPTSTLENWMREFEHFCSDLTVLPYHGLQKDRWGPIQAEIEEMQPNVVVTTYGMAKSPDDRQFLKSLKPIVCVFDEAHALKNPESQQYSQLMSLKCQFRVMLTGTPLQNNLRELVAMLGFLLPGIFDKYVEKLRKIFHHRAKTTTTSNDGSEVTSHAALLSEVRMQKAKAMLAPFVLRRKKKQVLKMLPPKTQQIRYCEMTPNQEALYRSEHARLKALMSLPKGMKKSQENVLMVLRKAAIHPWLFRRQYTDEVIRQMAQALIKVHPNKQEDYVYDDLSYMTDGQIDALMTEDKLYTKTFMSFRVAGSGFMDSGKVSALLELLSTYASQDARTLVFSQFTQVLDILERVFQEVGVKFVRLDGSTPIAERQPLLDLFYEDLSIPVFMLSTKAGGAGINLAAANRVIIFDASFNPQDDVQAENRAHRVGQTRPVEVVRLVTKGTIEEKILALGRTKLALGSRVAGGKEEASEAVDTNGTAAEVGICNGSALASQALGMPAPSADFKAAEAVASGDDEYDYDSALDSKEAAALEKAGQQKVLEMLMMDGAMDSE